MNADTIIALSTAPGTAGIGILRLSGPRAVDALQAVFSCSDSRSLVEQTARMLVLGWVLDAQGQRVDQALAVRFDPPHSYTGELMVELQAHGGTFHLQQIQASLLLASQSFLPPVRLARAGEFTERAFLNGKLDLTRAEAVADLIHSGSLVAREAASRQLAGGLEAMIRVLSDGVLALLAEAEAACDFPDDAPSFGDALVRAGSLVKSMASLIDGARTGRMLSQGVRVAIAGPPNAGKSSLLNALAGVDRAIVSPQPGTTRDWLELRYQIQGFPVLFYDTAGLRLAEGEIEAEGVRRAQVLIGECDLLLLVLDQNVALDESVLTRIDLRDVEVLFVLNKVDLDPAWDITVLGRALQVHAPALAAQGSWMKRMVGVSALRGEGLDRLRTRILDAALRGRAASMLEQVLLTQARHEEAMRRAAESLEQACASMQALASPELVAVDLRASLDALGEILGTTTRGEVLEAIFGRFCIGK